MVQAKFLHVSKEQLDLNFTLHQLQCGNPKKHHRYILFLTIEAKIDNDP